MVAEDELWFWVATSRKVADVEPTLSVYKWSRHKYPEYYDVDETGADEHGHVPLGEPPHLYWDPARFRCVALGQNLYVTLIGMWPKARRFRTDAVLGYNLKLTLVDEKGEQTVKWVTDLTGADEIRYPGYFLPTFYLPSKQSVLAHASCRRPGSDGADAFVDLDEYYAANAADVKKRPSALFLTGDQIYADDVAFKLFVAVRRLSKDLMGYDEYLPETYGRNKQYALEVVAGDIS